MPWTETCQAPLSMEFSRQEYWSGLPFPTSGDLPTEEFNPHLLGFLLGGQILYHLGSPDTDSLIIKFIWGFPGGSMVKNPGSKAGDVGSGRSSGEGNGNVFQSSCLGNPMDRRAWQATVHGITEESDTT